jgi:uncharacterized DUF497 family protein
VIRGPLGPCLPMPCPAVPTPVNPDELLHEPGDVAVRVTSEGLILVDTKFAYNIPELLTVIRSISDRPIKYVLASHYQCTLDFDYFVFTFDAALVAADIAHSSVTETRWIYLGPIDGVLHVGIVTYRGKATRVISLRRASRNERNQYEQAYRRP